MKKKSLSSTMTAATETLQKDQSKTRSEEEIVMNLIILYKEFHAIGLPNFLDEIVIKELKTLTGEEYVLSFDMQVGDLPVKGKVHVEADGPGGFYMTSYYELVLESLPETGKMRNAFLCAPSSLVTIEEAVNLLQQRYVYRKPEIDPIGEGYWIFLGEHELMPGFLRPLLLRSGFEVREYLAETGLGSWLGLEGWSKLVHDLEKGYRCDLTLGTGKGMRAVKVEADPAGQRLKVMNVKGAAVRM